MKLLEPNLSKDWNKSNLEIPCKETLGWDHLLAMTCMMHWLSKWKLFQSHIKLCFKELRWKNHFTQSLLFKDLIKLGMNNYLVQFISYLELKMNNMLLSWPTVEPMDWEVQFLVLVVVKKCLTRSDVD